MNKLFTIDTVVKAVFLPLVCLKKSSVEGIAGLFQERSFSAKFW